jgi:hypothetical protein
MAKLAIAAAVTLAATGAELLIASLTKPKLGQPSLQDLQVTGSVPGAPIPFGYGTCRFAGEVIWCSGISFATQTTHEGGSLGIGGTSTSSFVYTADIAVAFGEGPSSITRIWADSKLIYSTLPGDQSNYPVGAYPAWVSTETYNPGNLVSYNGQVFECLVTSTGITPSTIIPTSGPIYWELASDYPAWQPGILYQQGQTVTYLGQIYVEASPNGAFSHGSNPPLGNPSWQSLAQYYGTPTIYPGNQTQGVDPDIQASEGVDLTPAFRGLCYLKWMNLPLLNFGNRIPSLRAEVNFQKVASVL